MRDSAIQWCDATINPVMGCDGCELYPTTAQVISALSVALQSEGFNKETAKKAAQAYASFGPTRLMLERVEIAAELARQLPGKTRKPKATAKRIEKAIAACYRCYAAQLHRMWNTRGKNPGYARVFEEPRLFPGRMAEAARCKPLFGILRDNKPWLGGAPRMIFVSDMGDALSEGVPFDFLREEIIDVVTSDNGRQHIWLWLTKRPGKMVKFSRWLAQRGILWPDNLVAMTSVTSTTTAKRIDQLRQVPAKYRGLSVEPLWEGVDLDLIGIDWCIVGGESGGHAEPFHLEWAVSLQAQCADQGVAFFIKQLGKRPYHRGVELKFRDGHGGAWAEWPEHLRVREIPTEWLAGVPVQLPATQSAA